jgi:hypothetical protein
MTFFHKGSALGAAAILFAAAGAAQAQPASGAYYRELASIALPDGGWDYASFDGALGRVFVARADAVTAVDLAQGAASNIAGAARGHAVTPLQDGRELLVTDGSNNTARILDASSGAVLATIATGAKPDAALLEPTTGLALVMNGHAGTITLIDPATRAAVGEIAVGGALESAAADGHGLVLVNIEDAGDVAIVDMSSRTITGRIHLRGCEEPSGMVYATAARRFVSACANGVAAIIDPTHRRVERLLPIGDGPDAELYDEARDRVLIPAGKSGDLTILSASASGVRAFARIPTHAGARTGAIDPQSGRLFFPAADFAPPAQPGGRPMIRPGSVRLVILEPLAPGSAH